jgi:hypothetical protein
MKKKRVHLCVAWAKYPIFLRYRISPFSPETSSSHTIYVTQEDFEMAVTKVMKKDSDKNMSLRKLWK